MGLPEVVMMPIYLDATSYYSVVLFQKSLEDPPELDFFMEDRTLAQPRYLQSTAKFMFYYFIPVKGLINR